MNKYGLTFPKNFDDLQVEFFMIQRGGKWEEGGRSFGEGLFHHYKAAQTLIWPEDYHTRWSDLILKEILEMQQDRPVMAIMAPGSAGKTYTCARFALTDYYAFPQTTCTLISSTTLSGLERRVWGEIKNLHRKAKQKYSWLPGNCIDHLHVLTTDDIDEENDEVERIRDIRRGVICIACLSTSGQFTGISAYVGVKADRMRLIADECFPGDTMVDTPHGKQPIKSLRPGDTVLNPLGECRIAGVRKSISETLVRIRCSDEREIVCTPNHPIFTARGWVNAIDLQCMDYIFGVHEAMCILRGDVQAFFKPAGLRCLSEEEDDQKLQGVRFGFRVEKTQFDFAFLQHELRGKLDDEAAWGKRPDSFTGGASQTFQIENGLVGKERGFETLNVGANEATKSIAFSQEKGGSTGAAAKDFRRSRVQGETVPAGQGTRSGLECEIFIQGWTDKVRGNFAGCLPGRNLESCDSYETKTRKRIPVSLQDGCGISRHNAGRGGGRSISPDHSNGNTGPEENGIAGGAWVEDCQILKPSDFEQYANGDCVVEVYNLQVERHHTYSVNGLLVSNCQFMAGAFMDAIPNLAHNPDFKMIGLGNPCPTTPDCPLHQIAEPRDGWHSIPDDGKTKVWETKFMNGRCINLDGLDSPNNDFPGDKPKWPKLTNSRTLNLIARTYGLDSNEWFSQGRGVLRLGIAGRNVITMELCEQHHAMEHLTWQGDERTKIGFLDAAYGGVGGDRCVAGWLEFGKCTDGLIRILVHPLIMVPVKVMREITPEDQIAEYVSGQMIQFGVPPENFFFDARGSVATAFGRLWSPLVNTVEFGGRPSDRIVSESIFIEDENGRRRPKLANEHFSKFVSELWFSVRYAIEADQVRGLSREAILDGAPREFKEVRDHKVEVETKKDMKKRTNKSPDLFDAIVVGVEGARRRGFDIAKVAKTGLPGVNRLKKWFDEKRKARAKLAQSYTLTR